MKVEDRISLFKRKEGFEPQAYEVCPRFDRCSVNRCFLHPDYKKLKTLPDDKEQKCKVAKNIRKEIGTYFNLANKGLSEREFSGLQKWERLTPEQKEAIKQKARKSSLIVRLSEKGYSIAPKTKKHNSPTLSNELKTRNSAIVEPISSPKTIQRCLL